MHRPRHACCNWQASSFLLPFLLLTANLAVALGANHRVAVSNVCVLPLGDSLTQGVGSHGSYRQPLQALMANHFYALSNASSAATSVALAGAGRHFSFEYVGSNERTCTPKKPTTPFAPDPFTEKHEGHCGFNVHGVFTTLQQVSNGYECQPHIVLLMAGHNDAFQTARVCKLREGDESPTGRQKTCAYEMMRRPYLRVMEEMMDYCLRQFRPGVTQVVVGYNPTTHFPLLDQLIHGALGQLAQVYAKEPRVRFVHFRGWSEADTFDSTHPNTAGSQRMAQTWFDAIKDLGEVVAPQASEASRLRELERAMDALNYGSMGGLGGRLDGDTAIAAAGRSGGRRVSLTLEDGAAGGPVPGMVEPTSGRGSGRYTVILLGFAVVVALVWWIRQRRSAFYRRIPFSTV